MDYKRKYEKYKSKYMKMVGGMSITEYVLVKVNLPYNTIEKLIDVATDIDFYHFKQHFKTSIEDDKVSLNLLFKDDFLNLSAQKKILRSANIGNDDVKNLAHLHISNNESVNTGRHITLSISEKETYKTQTQFILKTTDANNDNEYGYIKMFLVIKKWMAQNKMLKFEKQQIPLNERGFWLNKSQYDSNKQIVQYQQYINMNQTNVSTNLSICNALFEEINYVLTLLNSKNIKNIIHDDVSENVITDYLSFLYGKFPQFNSTKTEDDELTTFLNLMTEHNKQIKNFADKFSEYFSYNIDSTNYADSIAAVKDNKKYLEKLKSVKLLCDFITNNKFQDIQINNSQQYKTLKETLIDNFNQLSADTYFLSKNNEIMNNMCVVIQFMATPLDDGKINDFNKIIDNLKNNFDISKTNQDLIKKFLKKINLEFFNEIFKYVLKYYDINYDTLILNLLNDNFLLSQKDLIMKILRLINNIHNNIIDKNALKIEADTKMMQYIEHIILNVQNNDVHFIFIVCYVFYNNNILNNNKDITDFKKNEIKQKIKDHITYLNDIFIRVNEFPQHSNFCSNINFLVENCKTYLNDDKSQLKNILTLIKTYFEKNCKNVTDYDNIKTKIEKIIETI